MELKSDWPHENNDIRSIRNGRRCNTRCINVDEAKKVCKIGTYGGLL